MVGALYTRTVARYEFVTIWQIRAPIERVWDAIYDSKRWPEWWQGVESVTMLRPADEQGLGGLTRYVWKSALPYQLNIDTSATRVDRPHAMDGHSTGELEGEGRWRLSEEDGVTTVRYEWDVATTKSWMNLVAPLLRPAFQWNHDVVMRHGGEGLARRGPSQSRVDLVAATAGVVHVRFDVLERLNRLDPLEVFTVFDGSIVDAGDLVASVKIAPHVVDEAILARAEGVATHGAKVVSVAPFVARRVAVVVKESIHAPARERFEASVRAKVESLDLSRLLCQVDPTGTAPRIHTRERNERFLPVCC